MPSLPTARLVRPLARYALAAALALPALLPGPAYADNPSPPSGVAAIEVPARNRPFLLGHAVGTQNFVCNGSAWVFAGPSATLVDDKGKQIMTHYSGPTWETNNGSKVVGQLEKSTPSPIGAIPWLLLRAASTTPGQLKTTTYIQRVNTTGGLAPPTSECDGTKIGVEQKVPYTADYYFYKAGGPA
jgi:hypothetical protein